MSLTVEQIYEEALLLPNESKVILAERLVAYVGTHNDNPMEQRRLETAKRRRDELRSGDVQPIDGEEGLKRVRRAIGI